MQKQELSKRGEYPSSDFDFDFDIDLRITGFEYLLLALYAVFVFSFVLIRELVVQPALEYMRKSKEAVWEKNDKLQPSVPHGPCCVRPRITHG